MTHGNVAFAGVLRGGVLSLQIVAQHARWHPEADDGPAIYIETLGVEGSAPSIPGPLTRVRAGTRIETSIRNALPDALRVFSLSGSGGRDTLRIRKDPRRLLPLEAPGGRHDPRANSPR